MSEINQNAVTQTLDGVSMNGHSSPQSFTFKSTGVTIQVRPVAPGLLNSAHEGLTKPYPPQVQVTNVDGSTRWEPNPHDPDYVSAQAAYRRKLGNISQRVMIRRGIVLELNAEQRAELQQLRDEMAEDGVTLDKDDKVAYIFNIAAGTPEDLGDLVSAIAQWSGPTDPKSASG